MIRLGTRRSVLATVQANLVADALRAGGHEVELVPIQTTGDANKVAPVEQIGGTGIYVSALRDALLAGEIDIAVHSLKDLPTAPLDGLTIGAIPVREDPRDVLVARDGLTLGELPRGALIGTGAPRRAAQIDALGLGVECTGVRGNVDTRINLVAEGKVDAVVLARAGLARLGRLAEVTETLDPIQVLPSPGQGALAVECRSDDTDVLAALAPLEDPSTRAAVTAERQLLATLEAGCTAPVGALAEVVEGEDGPELWLRGALGQDDGVRRLSANGPVDDPVALGKRLANELLE
ncbi:hydroxymethylbilane synthase [Kribbella kalugense]|uniref:Porphobilinogen deaminase n=1 Tax=Kribbella kalugense TaxID=2512221 RepID=A0A4R7ZPV4_9ACTN|nr:hydroxymethylbilane synthase [Kribbella kalugense]TDW17360.1 hydroxymethylbilane synthase [Kribbella kalugense]